jgi:hypothetical protein
MHYPQCNGTSVNLSFTDLDAEGPEVVKGLDQLSGNLPGAHGP